MVGTALFNKKAHRTAMISDKLPQLVLLFSYFQLCIWEQTEKVKRRKSQKPLGNLGKGGLPSLHCISSGVAKHLCTVCPRCGFSSWQHALLQRSVWERVWKLRITYRHVTTLPAALRSDFIRVRHLLRLLVSKIYGFLAQHYWSLALICVAGI